MCEKEKTAQDIREEAIRELEFIKGLSPTLREFMEPAERKLQAIIDGVLPKVLDWEKLTTRIIERRPRIVQIGTRVDWNSTRRVCFDEGSVSAPAVSWSSWDMPCVSFDFGEIEECGHELEITADTSWPTFWPQFWPRECVSRMEKAGIKVYIVR
ncbi:hypothetical protein NAD41_000913 [Salmonella enterica]|nr:hypothetical protein [Salmonella enterica]EKK6596297.1 hypothetical protein [Salmonella enterica]